MVYKLLTYIMPLIKILLAHHIVRPVALAYIHKASWYLCEPLARKFYHMIITVHTLPTMTRQNSQPFLEDCMENSLYMWGLKGKGQKGNKKGTEKELILSSHFQRNLGCHSFLFIAKIMKNGWRRGQNSAKRLERS